MGKATRLTSEQFRELPETVTPTELIDGVVVVSPSPKLWHQLVLSRLHVLVAQKVTTGVWLFAPMDVYLDEHNAVQPDLFWVAPDGPARPIEGYWYGAPNVVVEVLSAGSVRLDRGDKFRLYERYGVSEYWIVDPVEQYVEVWQLVGGQYRQQGLYGPDATLTSPRLGCTLSLSGLFDDVEW